MREWVNKITKDKKLELIFQLLAMIALMGFILLTALIVIYPTGIIDKWFSLEIQENSSPLFDVMMTAISTPGYMKVTIPLVIGMAAIFLFFKKTRQSLFIALTLLSGLFSSVVKYFVNRPRPAKDLVRIIEITRQQSFPSGHVTFYTVFFGFLIFLMYSIKEIPQILRLSVATISALFIMMISISRIYLGAHWLTDVLGGYFLGSIVLYSLVYLYKK
ncbi:membrane-associated phospholipid phosphatase [Pedobacter sp. CG_S7]|uniref:phosphatase PAP2 family protein n=1 Tax=Pedobacter sp. CG_S7 TaxID=3143930 RepID=UPI00339960BF